MCGIFGYIGKQPKGAQIVLEGLKTLEYRGYDSWGIAVKTGDKITYEKHIGKIGNAATNLPKSTLAINMRVGVCNSNASVCSPSCMSNPYI